MTRRALPAVFLLLLALTVSGARSFRERLVYYSVNLRKDGAVAELEGVMRRAARAGYTGIVLSDFSSSLRQDARYPVTAAQLKKLAAGLGLEIIPAVFPIGDSRTLLAEDPNLAEGLPVRDALYVVDHGIARLQPEPVVNLRDGNFADLSQWDGKDANLVRDGDALRAKDPHGEQARIFQTVKVHPFRQYHVSVRIKTQDFDGIPKITAVGGKQALNFADLGVAPTQEWTEHHATFNSLDHDEVTIYFGCWKGNTGTVWWAHAKLEEVGLVNVLRRAGAPLVVKREGGAVLAEGEDFEPVADPLLGRADGGGSYDVWHEPPLIHTRLPDGARLRVSYYHPVTFFKGKVMICPSEPKTMALLRDQARRLHEVWGARAYFMSHDEVRALNWDESCARRRLDAGALLADHVRVCVRMLRELDPGVRIYVWSDMFDPNANARPNYYLVRGDLSRSWDALDEKVVVALWTVRNRDASLGWFAARRQPMLIAGYYDSAPEGIRDWLRAAKPFDGVVGVMYTTWKHRYADLERFAAEIRD